MNIDREFFTNVALVTVCVLIGIIGLIAGLQLEEQLEHMVIIIRK